MPRTRVCPRRRVASPLPLLTFFALLAIVPPRIASSAEDNGYFGHYPRLRWSPAGSESGEGNAMASDDGIVVGAMAEA